MTDHDITLVASYNESVETKIVTYAIHIRYKNGNFN